MRNTQIVSVTYSINLGKQASKIILSNNPKSLVSKLKEFDKVNSVKLPNKYSSKIKINIAVKNSKGIKIDSKLWDKILYTINDFITKSNC